MANEQGDTDLHSFFASTAVRPRIVKARYVRVDTKPRAPTSSVSNCGFQKLDSAKLSRSFVYFASLRSFAACRPSSAGTVSSSKITARHRMHQITTSGRSLVAQIDGGKTY